MKATSRLIDVAGTALLPLNLRREGITAYQCPEEDAYDFVVSIEGRLIRIELKAVNGDSEYPTAEKITKKQFDSADFIVIYLLDKNQNRFFTIPTKKMPRNTSIRFTKTKDGKIKGKWMKFEGFDYLKKEISWWKK
ncbi:hypothetical protein DRH13_04785 [Candidatus Woesebacteria bacterium]|nr:MAG: hypothetical protein DRH13_04785 [Candidatus Woesebacteria bacterium]